MNWVRGQEYHNQQNNRILSISTTIVDINLISFPANRILNWPIDSLMNTTATTVTEEKTKQNFMYCCVVLASYLVKLFSFFSGCNQRPILFPHTLASAQCVTVSNQLPSPGSWFSFYPNAQRKQQCTLVGLVPLPPYYGHMCFAIQPHLVQQQQGWQRRDLHLHSIWIIKQAALRRPLVGC